MLIGNYTPLLKSPGKNMSGSSISDNRANINQSGQSRNMYFSLGESIPYIVSIPVGYQPGYSWIIAQSSGGMASFESLDGSSSVSSSNLAGGLNATATITNSGSISDAAILWIGVISSTISNSGTISSAVLSAIGDIVSTISNSGSISTATLYAAISGSADLSGSSNITLAQLIGTLNATATILSESNVDLASLAGAINASSTISNSSSISASIKAIWNMITDQVLGEASLNIDISAEGDMSVDTDSTSSMDNTISATGDISSDITIIGDSLTTLNVANAVWSATADSTLSYQDIMKILVAIAAGKTTIVDLGGGSATVTFRDIGDTKDRVSADMTGSERTTVTIDVDDGGG